MLPAMGHAGGRATNIEFLKIQGLANLWTSCRLEDREEVGGAGGITTWMRDLHIINDGAPGVVQAEDWPPMLD